MTGHKADSATACLSVGHKVVLYGHSRNSCVVFALFIKSEHKATFSSPENSRINLPLRVRLFCMALVEQLGNDSW